MDKINFVKWEDWAEYLAYIKSKIELLTAISPDVAQEVKRLEREEKRVKPFIQGECGMVGHDLATDHLQVTFRSGSERVNGDVVRVALKMLEELAESYPELKGVTLVLESAFSRSDDSGAVHLKMPMDEVTIKRWDNELKEMAG